MVVDDVSISSSSDDDDDGDEDEEDCGDGDGSVAGSIDSLDSLLDSGSGSGSGTCTTKSSRSGGSKTDEEIIILDSDDDQDGNNKHSRSHTDSIIATTLRGAKKKRKATKTKPKPKTKTANGNGNDTKLQKKYKLLKQKLKSLKESAAEYQKMNRMYLETKQENAELKESHQDSRSKYEQEIYNNRKNKRLLKELKEQIDGYQEEMASLKTRAIAASMSTRKQMERCIEQRDSAKVGSMEEMKEITAREKKWKGKYEELAAIWKTDQLKLKDLEKENAHLKRIMNQSVDQEVTQRMQEQKKVKPMSRKHMIESFQAGMQEAENEQMMEEVEARAVRRQLETKNMMRRSSSQATKVLAAAKKQQKRTTRPTFMDARSVAPDIAKPVPQRPQSKPVPQRQSTPSLSSSGSRKRPLGLPVNKSSDLRNIFKKK